MSAKGNPTSADPQAMNPGPRTLRKRQADRSDVRQEFARFTKPDPVSGPMDKRTGASPSCLRSISRPLPLKTYPFRFAPTRRMRPLLSGALTTPFIQRRITIAGFRFSVKNFASKVYQKRGRLSRWLWLPSAVAGPLRGLGRQEQNALST